MMVSFGMIKALCCERKRSIKFARKTISVCSESKREYSLDLLITRIGFGTFRKNVIICYWISI